VPLAASSLNSQVALSDRFITFEDMQGILGGSTEHASLERIWADSLLECKAPDIITYDDFKRLMKGQPKAGSSRGFGGPGSIAGPSDRSIGLGIEPIVEGVEANSPPPGHRRMRSQSFQDHSNQSDMDSSTKSLGNEPSHVSLLLQTRSERILEVKKEDSSMSPLVVNRSLYRKHREMRLAVLEASKQFDKKRTERLQNDNGDKPFLPPSLIMKRGAVAPEELEDAHQKAVFEAATKRSGRTGRRAGRTRNKTLSDVTGMMAKPVPL
jgi:hypothetical protein